MENYQGVGDLTDILLATNSVAVAAAAASTAPYGTTSTTSTTTTTTSSSSSSSQYHHWQQQQQQQFHSNSDPIMMSSSCFSSILDEDPIIPIRGSSSSNNNHNMFGDPFSTMRDPFLHDLDIPSSYFNTNTTTPSSASANNTSSSSSVFAAHNHKNNNNSKVVAIQDHEMMRSSSIRPPPPHAPSSCKNIFSNMIQISPNNIAKLPLYDSSSSSQPMVKPSSLLSPNKDSHLLDHNNNINNTNTSLQISSPRNPGLKRRKNQAKKVVCIPAPAAANSRQTGEVVPSDLWAWRKYGQKPIKGSPYPRGYYRCSSSKGCSARKQVERSRTDPNMLVITYTSEHNHPWPTQRNALAGSTRSQPSKSNNNASNSKNGSETSQKCTTTNGPKEENQQQEMMSNNNNSEVNNGSSPVTNSAGNNSSVKEEIEEIEKHLEIMDDGEFSDGVLPSYKPSMMMMDDDQGNNNSNSEDFFAELGEIEADPLNLLFSTTQGFNAGGVAGDLQIQRESRALDPFHIFDWSGGDTNPNSFEDHNNKGRL